jgi:DNA-binding Lrp family transcriptional regulator
LLTPTEKAVLLALLFWARSKPSCWPSDRAIGERIGRSVGQVQRTLRVLESKGVIRREKTAENRTGRVIVLRWREIPTASAREAPPAPARDELRDQREERTAAVAECVTGTPRPPEEKTDGPDDWRRVVAEFGEAHPVGRMAAHALAELGQLAEPGHVVANMVQGAAEGITEVITENAAAESAPLPSPVVSVPARAARSTTPTPRPARARGVSAPSPGITASPRPRPQSGHPAAPAGPQTFGMIWGAHGSAPWVRGVGPRPSG